MLIAADCGASRVVLARFSGDKSGAFRLEGLSVQPLEGAAEADWPAKASEAVLRGIKEFGGAAKIHLILPGNVCYGKFVKLARVEPGKLAKVVQFEAKQSIPYPLEEVAYSHVVVGDDGVDLDIALAAVKLDVVEPLCRGVEKAGAQAVSVEPAFMAEANAARALGAVGQDGKSALILGIGARTTNVIVLEADKTFARTLNLGGATVTQAIADELGRTFAEAEEIKLGLSRGELEADAESPELAAFNNAVKSFSSRLAIEVTRTLATQKKSVGAESLSAVYLTGDGSLLAGLDSVLSDRLRAPLGMLELVGAVETGPAITGEGLAAAQPQLLALVGVAARAFNPTIPGFNLLPASIASENRFRRQQPFLLAAAACLAGSLAFPIIGFSAKAKSHERDLSVLVDQVAQFEQLNTQIQKDKSEIERVRGNITGIEDLARSRSNWLSFFAELQDRLYQVGDVWIERLQVTRPSAAGASGAIVEGGQGGMFGGMASQPAATGESAPASPAIRLALTGRLVDRANPLSKVSKEAEERVKRLLRNFSESQFIVSVENERFDNSQKGILQFDFVLVVNPKKPL